VPVKTEAGKVTLPIVPDRPVTTPDAFRGNQAKESGGLVLNVKGWRLVKQRVLMDVRYI